MSSGAAIVTKRRARPAYRCAGNAGFDVLFARRIETLRRRRLPAPGEALRAWFANSGRARSLLFASFYSTAIGNRFTSSSLASCSRPLCLARPHVNLRQSVLPQRKRIFPYPRPSFVQAGRCPSGFSPAPRPSRRFGIHKAGNQAGREQREETHKSLTDRLRIATSHPNGTGRPVSAGVAGPRPQPHRLTGASPRAGEP